MSANWPTDAPRHRRCSPNSDMMFTVASVSRRRDVQVGAVGRVEPEARHHLRVDPRVDPLGPPGAVLVVLDGHQRRLRASLDAVEPRDHPGLGVGLLEVVERALRDVLVELPALAVAGEVPRRPAALDGFHEQGVDGRLDVVAPLDLRAARHRGTGPRGGHAVAAGRGPTPARRRRRRTTGSAARSSSTARAGGRRPGARRRDAGAGRTPADVRRARRARRSRPVLGDGAGRARSAPSHRRRSWWYPIGSPHPTDLARDVRDPVGGPPAG